MAYLQTNLLMSKGTHEVTEEEYTQHIIVINMELTAIMKPVLFVKRDWRHCTDADTIWKLDKAGQ